MSIAQDAHRPARRGRSAKLWLALLALIAAGVALAWAGTSPLRGETTESGLRIRTVEEGTGAFVQPVDGVMVEYEGRLTDGTVFDASERHGGPQPMIAGNVIPGFAEALTKMQQGGRYRIQIPGKLAYGANPPPGSPFGPNADLEFDVHIVQLVPNAALMTGGAPAAPGAPPAPEAAGEGTERQPDLPQPPQQQEQPQPQP
jgi:FKBP-type peptidyl-prolyl cis-trans isomerase FkpA